MELDELACKNGITLMMSALDDVFEVEECDKIDEVVNAFWTMRRHYGEAMENYINCMSQAKRMMEKEDPETHVGDKAYAVQLLKRAGLKKEEQQQVLSATGAEYERAQIETALRRLFKDVAVSDARAGRLKPKGPGKGDKDQGKGKNPYFKKSYGAHAAEVDTDEDEEEEALYSADDAEDSDDDPFGILAAEEDSDSEEDPDMTEAMAAFQSAKKRLATVKKIVSEASAKEAAKAQNLQ